MRFPQVSAGLQDGVRRLRLQHLLRSGRVGCLGGEAHGRLAADATLVRKRQPGVSGSCTRPQCGLEAGRRRGACADLTLAELTRAGTADAAEEAKAAGQLPAARPQGRAGATRTAGLPWAWGGDLL